MCPALSSSSASSPSQQQIASSPPGVIGLDEGWQFLWTSGIEKLEAFLDKGEIAGRRDDGTECLFTNRDYAELYSTVYLMCTQRVPNCHTASLYARYGDCIVHYVQKQVIGALKPLTGWPLMAETLKRWSSHKTYSKWMERIFTYLDRYHVKLHAELSLHDRGIGIFRDWVFPCVKEPLRNAVLAAIQEDRDGVTIDKELLRSIISMYLELSYGSYNVYQAELEADLLDTSSKYYDRKSSEWIAEKDFGHYLESAEDALESERERCCICLCERSVSSLRDVVVGALLRNPMCVFLQNNSAPITQFLEDNSVQHLQRVYRLFGLVEGGLAEVCNAFKEFVVYKGNNLVDCRSCDDHSFVWTMLALHDTYKAVVNECFKQDTIFQKALREAFETFVNRDLGKSSFYVLLSSFCDRILKRTSTTSGKGGASFLMALATTGTAGGAELNSSGVLALSDSADEVVESTLCKVVELFNYIMDKDLFADHYRQALSKRLLFETSESQDYEKSMIAKLKLKCGSQYTTRLEGMINDLTVAADLQRKFRENCNPESLCNIHFTAQVLHTGYWPTPATMFDVELPPEMSQCLRAFEEFYEKHGGRYRKLTWVHGLGNAVVSSTFPHRKHDLICNTYQACLLLLFNQPEPLDFTTIKSHLNCSDELYVKKILHTFVLGKFRVLKRVAEEAKEDTAESTGGNAQEGVGDTKAINWSKDKFEVNPHFRCPNRLIKIPSPQQDEQLAKERIEEDRSLAIEAAVVRFMKARKQMTHSQIVSDVLGQLSVFKPHPKMIKLTIEKLIEREFLERDSANPNMYKYLA